MPLTDAELENAQSGQGKNKRFDGHGLFLWVKPNGSKLWRWKYRFGGAEKALPLGTYPSISLKQAREDSQEARKLLRSGFDPASSAKLRRYQRESRSMRSRLSI